LGQDKKLLYSVFPTLAEGLRPVAEAFGLHSLELGPDIAVTILGTVPVVESILAPLMETIDQNASESLCVSLDAEWNITRTVGVSIIQLAPHSVPNEVYIIPVCEQLSRSVKYPYPF
jgi:hypothetical protein